MSSLSVSVDYIFLSPQNQKWVHPPVPHPRKRGKGPRRWRQEGKYLFCGLSVELQTSVCLLRKLSPAREQRKQTIPHHAVWLAADPRVFVCSRQAAMTDGGTLGRKKSEEGQRGNKNRRVGGGGGGRAVSWDRGLMEDYTTDGVLVLFPKAFLPADRGRTVFKNNSQHML